MLIWYVVMVLIVVMLCMMGSSWFIDGFWVYGVCIGWWLGCGG